MTRPAVALLLFLFFNQGTYILAADIPGQSIQADSLTLAATGKARPSGPPVSIEGLFSNRGAYLQMGINRRFASLPRFGFFSVGNVLRQWDQESLSDLMSQGKLTYSLSRQIRLTAGYHLTPATGIRPSVGIQFSHSTPVLLLIANPRYDFSARNNAEIMLLGEFKPGLSSKDWGIYSRIQALYVYTPSLNQHARSYLKLRAGLSYREFSFGLGSNIDYYGPQRRHELSVGLFTRALLY